MNYNQAVKAALPRPASAAALSVPKPAAKAAPPAAAPVELKRTKSATPQKLAPLSPGATNVGAAVAAPGTPATPKGTPVSEDSLLQQLAAAQLLVERLVSARETVSERHWPLADDRLQVMLTCFVSLRLDFFLSFFRLFFAPPHLFFLP